MFMVAPGTSDLSDASNCTVGFSNTFITEPLVRTFTNCCCFPFASKLVGGFLIVVLTLSGSLDISGNVILAPLAATVNIVPFTVVYS